MNTVRPVFSGNEVRFSAENEMVMILPSFRESEMHFIEGDYGPFLPNFPTKVPLWLAVQLKKMKKCSIQPPDWMTVAYLTRHLKLEQDDDRYFQELPYAYAEVAKVILENAPDDFSTGDAKRVRNLLKDIADVRSNKIKQGLEQIPTAAIIKLNNISQTELNEIRGMCVEALNDFRDIASMGAVAPVQMSQPSQQPSQASQPRSPAADPAGPQQPGRKLRKFRD